MLESLIADKSGGKRTIRKDIDGNILMKIDEFHKTSFYWNYLLNFSSKFMNMCDLLSWIVLLLISSSNFKFKKLKHE